MKEYPLMDPKNDLAFKLLFGQPRSAEMLMAFLNALLHRTGADRITAIEFANSEFAGDHKEDRGSRLDVYVRTDAGEHINVEIQIAEQDIAKRTLFYWATIFKAQIRKNAQWADFPQTITINIVNFTVFASTKRYHTSYQCALFRYNARRQRLTKTDSSDTLLNCISQTGISIDTPAMGMIAVKP